MLRLFKDDEPGVRAKIEMVLSPSGADTPPQRTPEREALAAAHAAQLMSQSGREQQWTATMDGLAKGISAHKGKYRVRLTLTSADDGGASWRCRSFDEMEEFVHKKSDCPGSSNLPPTRRRRTSSNGNAIRGEFAVDFLAKVVY